MYDGGDQPYFQRPERMVFDGKRMRKPVTRRTIDYGTNMINLLEKRLYQSTFRDYDSLQPHPTAILDDNPHTSVTTKYVHTSTNKVRCPVNRVVWTPEGRRLITGCSSGEFTLWNGLTFNFETILQAHDTAVRAMRWSHNHMWMMTADHEGTIKYWQSTMNNSRSYSGHKEAIRDLTFSPTDQKFASCSDDGTVKVWDFEASKQDCELTGHGWDVKCLSWHPHKGLLVSGSKDNLIKLWDPKTGKNLRTLHGHKNTVLQVDWNQNGNWLLSASRDQLIKVFDLRMLKEMQTFRGHRREVTALAWHPHHEEMFCSGGFDGSIMFWCVGEDDPAGEMACAHDNAVWSLAWHPIGHILASGSNDHTTKFWTRNRPGELMRDKYNIGQIPGLTKKDEIIDPTDFRSKQQAERQQQQTGVFAPRGPIVDAPLVSGVIPGVSGANGQLVDAPAPSPQQLQRGPPSWQGAPESTPPFGGQDQRPGGRNDHSNNDRDREQRRDHHEQRHRQQHRPGQEQEHRPHGQGDQRRPNDRHDRRDGHRGHDGERGRADHPDKRQRRDDNNRFGAQQQGQGWQGGPPPGPPPPGWQGGPPPGPPPPGWQGGPPPGPPPPGWQGGPPPGPPPPGWQGGPPPGPPPPGWQGGPPPGPPPPGWSGNNQQQGHPGQGRDDHRGRGDNQQQQQQQQADPRRRDPRRDPRLRS